MQIPIAAQVADSASDAAELAGRVAQVSRGGPERRCSA